MLTGGKLATESATDSLTAFGCIDARDKAQNLKDIIVGTVVLAPVQVPTTVLACW
jgi:hypothetical protein